MFSKAYLKDLLERAAATFAESLAAGLVVGASVLDQPWGVALGVAAGATVLSVLKSFVARAKGNPEDASLVK